MTWLSVVDVSNRAGIPPETIRRYITRHSLHLQVKKGHKTYSIAESCIPVFIQIRSLYAEGKTADEIETELARSGRPTIITVNDDGESVNTNVPEALSDLENRLIERLDAVNERQNVLADVVREMMQQQRETAVTLLDPVQLRSERVTDRLIERRVERQLEREALELWLAKPISNRQIKIGLFRKKEDVNKRDLFVRDYVDDNYEERILKEYQKD